MNNKTTQALTRLNSPSSPFNLLKEKSRPGFSQLCRRAVPAAKRAKFKGRKKAAAVGSLSSFRDPRIFVTTGSGAAGTRKCSDGGLRGGPHWDFFLLLFSPFSPRFFPFRSGVNDLGPHQKHGTDCLLWARQLLPALLHRILFLSFLLKHFFTTKIYTSMLL